MSNDLEKALELLRQARPRVEGMHLAQGCRADQGHIGLLREIDAFLASHHSVEANDMGRAEGAQGEREAFEAWWSSSGLTKFKDTAQAAWEARAALAQPSPARCQCCGYLVTDSEHRSCLRAAQQPSPAPELAVLERWGSSYEAFSPDLVRQDTGRYVKFVDATASSGRCGLRSQA